MTGYPCCCVAGCWQWSDNFDRPELTRTTDVGGNWHEVVGNWGIFYSGTDGMLFEKYYDLES